MSNRLNLTFTILIMLCFGFVNVTASTEQEQDQPATSSSYKYYFAVGELWTSIGIIFLALMMVMCTLGGIGGNIVILPVCLVFFQFDPHVAVGHTNFFSAISSLVRVGVEMTKKSKAKNLNFDVSLLSCTPCIIGSVFGVFLNKMCPNILILILATLLLTTLMIKSFKDYKKMALAEETGANAYQLKVKSGLIEVDHVEGMDQAKEQLIELEDKKLAQDAEVAVDLHDQYSLVPRDTFFYAIIFLIVPAFSLIRGTKERPSIIGMNRCGKLDFTFVICYLGLLTFLTLFLKRRIQVRNRFVKQNDANVNFKRDDSTNRLLFTMVGVGFVGSFLAAGYSVLLNISLMMLELSPFAASASALFIGVIFSLAASLSFYLEGLLYLNCAIVGAIVIAVSTLAVRLTLYEQFLKTGKASLILLFMTIMIAMGIATIISVVAPKIKSVHDAGGNIWEFASIC